MLLFAADAPLPATRIRYVLGATSPAGAPDLARAEIKRARYQGAAERNQQLPRSMVRSARSVTVHYPSRGRGTRSSA